MTTPRERDPRICPRIGDVLRQTSPRRGVIICMVMDEVSRRSLYPTHFVVASTHGGSVSTITKKVWWRWAADAEVIHAAD